MPSVLGFETMNEPHPGWLGPEVGPVTAASLLQFSCAWADRKERLHQGAVRGGFSRTDRATHASACRSGIAKGVRCPCNNIAAAAELRD